MIAFVLTMMEFGNTCYASFRGKYAKVCERLQIVLCKYCSGGLQMRERRVKESDRGGIRVKCRYKSHHLFVLYSATFVTRSTDLVC